MSDVDTKQFTADRWPPYLLDPEKAAAIDRVRPALAETEVEAEEQRHLPRRAFDALAAEGMWKVAWPKEIGGWDVEPLLEFEIYEGIGRINTSACWNFTAGCVNTSVVAACLPDEATAEIFGSGHDVVFAGQAAPFGTGRRVSGGLRVSGHYSWGTGITHSEWVLGGFTIPAEAGDGQPEAFVFVTKRENVRVLDNWHVIGIAGSGSFDYEVDDLFIPEGYWFSFSNPRPLRGGPRFTQPIKAQIVPAHCGVALGAGERALDEISRQAYEKTRLEATSTVAERGAFQRDLGHAHTMLSAARDRIARLLQLVARKRVTGEPVTDAFLMQLVAGETYATEAGVAVAQLAYKYGGASALRLDNPLQRILRDLLVAQQHHIVADTSYDALGAALAQQG